MELVWEESYYVPKLGISLFSCTQITKQGINVLFNDTNMQLIPGDRSKQIIYGLFDNEKPSISISSKFLVQNNEDSA